MNPAPDRPRGLGRGLSALIGDEVAAVKGEPAARKDTRTLPVAFLQPGRYQPRKTFDEQPLADLAASIREKGVLSPILVRPVGLDRYEIVAGERRWRAAQLAQLHDVPVVVRELADMPRRNFILRDALEEYSVHGEFSYILIDCPPSLTLLTLNAMAAADAVMVPLQCEFFALEGLSQLMKTIELVRDRLNPTLEIQGIVLTMFDKRNKLSDQVAADVRETLGEKVYSTVIPRNVRISEAPSHGVPALVYDLRCPGSQAYIKLAGELIQRERLRVAA